MDPRPLGFDASVRFQPDWRALDEAPTLPVGPGTARVYDYGSVWPRLAAAPDVPWRRYPTVCPGWDNTPRRKAHATVLHRANPKGYEQWLRHAVASVQDQPADHRLVFINGWNEWGEGCHLEPDRRHGHALETPPLEHVSLHNIPEPAHR
jgi:hypothetical protein